MNYSLASAFSIYVHGIVCRTESKLAESHDGRDHLYSETALRYEYDSSASHDSRHMHTFWALLLLGTKSRSRIFAFNDPVCFGLSFFARCDRIRQNLKLGVGILIPLESIPSYHSRIKGFDGAWMGILRATPKYADMWYQGETYVLPGSVT